MPLFALWMVGFCVQHTVSGLELKTWRGAVYDPRLSEVAIHLEAETSNRILTKQLNRHQIFDEQRAVFWTDVDTHEPPMLHFEPTHWGSALRKFATTPKKIWIAVARRIETKRLSETKLLLKPVVLNKRDGQRQRGRQRQQPQQRGQPLQPKQRCQREVWTVDSDVQIQRQFWSPNSAVFVLQGSNMAMAQVGRRCGSEWVLEWTAVFKHLTALNIGMDLDALDLEGAYGAINKLRRHLGRSALIVHESLESIARDDASNRMKGMRTRGPVRISHVYRGADPHDRAWESGLAVSHLAENLAVVRGGLQEALALWLESPTHLFNLIQPDAVYMGIAHLSLPESDSKRPANQMVSLLTASGSPVRLE